MHAQPKATRILLTLCAVFPALAAADTYIIDSRHTFPSFEISHLGFSVQRGRFNKTTGQFTLDTDKKTGSIHAVIDAASIDTGLEELEAHLRKDDFFNVAKYPTITYDADRLVFEGDRPVRAEGNLTLLGVTRPVPLALDHFHCGLNPIQMKYVCGANATGTLKRGDFGMTKYLPMVGDEVRIVIQVEGFRE
jgi:polyisoprenoid-binding protein YceI